MSVINAIISQAINKTNSPKFTGVFGATPRNLFSFQGYGLFNKSYIPTASAFINELKHNGWGNVQFSITQAGAGNPSNLYSFVGVIDSSNDLATVTNKLEIYFRYYFNQYGTSLIQVQQQTFNNISVSGSVSGLLSQIIDIETSSSAFNVNLQNVKKQLESLGWRNVTVSAVALYTIRIKADTPNNQNNEITAKDIVNRNLNVSSIISNPLPSVNINDIYTEALKRANATGQSVSDALKEVTDEISSISGRAASGLDKNSFNLNFLDDILKSDTVQKMALALGISAGLTVLLMFAGGALFLKVYTSK